jgi:hypothetical protein
MVRHPHFTQPVFVRFPRPAVMSGPAGVRQYPPVADVPFEEAVVRQLAALDRRVSPARIKDSMAGRREEDVRRALLATKRARPEDVVGFFTASLGRAVARQHVRPEGSATTPLRQVEDPYAT